MKIAILAPYWNPPQFEGGVSRVIFELRKQWLAKGHTVAIFSPNTQPDAKSDIYKIPIPPLPLRSIWINVWLLLFKKLKGYDIIFPQSAAQALFIDRKRCLPFVHTLSDVEEKKPWRFWRHLIPWLEEMALKDIAGCLTLSDDTVAILCSRCGVPAERIHKIQNGVDYDTFLPSADAKAGSFTFFSAGRFIPRKRFAILIRAFALLVRNHPDTKLIVAGAGKLEESLKNLVEQLGLGQHVYFPGMLDQPSLLANYQKAHAFVLPSEAEGMPMVVLEAQSCALPVVIGDFLAAPEMVRHGKTGFIVKTDDPKEWAKYLNELVENAELCQEFGCQARADVIAACGWDSVAAKIETLFLELV
jgi:glycosyltransferase involved in cell wall biosynthesis